MKLMISISLLVYVLLLLPSAQTVCLSSTQLDGLCSSCSPNQTLQSGYCIVPMAGCISQISQNMCGQCNSSYILINYSCSLLSSSTPTTPNIQTTLSIYADTAPDYRYQLLDLYFKGKYSQQLVDKISNLTQLVQLKTTYGSIYSILYANPYTNASTLYRAEALVDYFNVITEYSFTVIPASAVNDFNVTLWFINRRVVVQNLNTLKEAILNKVQFFTNNDYRLFYVNFNGQIFVIDVQRVVNTSSVYQTFTALTQLYYQINQNTVINYVFSQFPNLQLHTNYTVNYYSIMDNIGNFNDYYKFIFDTQIIVIIEVKDLYLNLYSYEEPDNLINLINQPKTNTTAPSLPGGYLPFLNLNDALYLKVYRYLIAQYPILATKNIQGVRYQMVAGTNFMIILNGYPFNDDEYIAVVNQPLGNATPSVTSLYKNSMDIKNTIINNPFAVAGVFNFQADTTFRNAYIYFRQIASQKISHLLPISSVKYFINSNLSIDYLIVYNSAEYGLVRYDSTQAQPYNILSYYVDGIQILLSNTVSTISGSIISRDSLLNFLATSKSSLFSTLIVIKQNFQPETHRYEFDAITQYGTYFIRINQNGLLYLSRITQTSQNLCSDIDNSQFTNNPVIGSLNTYLKASYSQLSGYTLALLQGYMTITGSISYRMVYALNSGRIEVQIVYANSKYIVNKLANYGGGTCDNGSIMQSGNCLKSCQSFVF